jgi:hypothetical protein
MTGRRREQDAENPASARQRSGDSCKAGGKRHPRLSRAFIASAAVALLVLIALAYLV